MVMKGGHFGGSGCIGGCAEKEGGHFRGGWFIGECMGME